MIDKAREFVTNNAATGRYLWVHPESDSGYVFWDYYYGQFGLNTPDSKYYYRFMYDMLDFAERRGYAGVYCVTEPQTNMLFVCPFVVFDSIAAAKRAPITRDAISAYNLATRETITL